MVDLGDLDAHRRICGCVVVCFKARWALIRRGVGHVVPDDLYSEEGSIFSYERDGALRHCDPIREGRNAGIGTQRSPTVTGMFVAGGIQRGRDFKLAGSAAGERHMM